MHLFKLLGELQFLFLRKYIVPAAKRVAADLLEFAVSEIADAATGGKSFKTPAKTVGRQTVRKQFGSGSGKKSASRVLKSAKQTSRSRRSIFNVSH